MDGTIEALLKQLEETQRSIRDCQNKLTISLVVVCIAIVLIIFIIFKGKGYFSKDKVIIGDVKDKDELHREVSELRKLVDELKDELKAAKNKTVGKTSVIEN